MFVGMHVSVCLSLFMGLCWGLFRGGVGWGGVGRESGTDAISVPFCNVFFFVNYKYVTWC